MIRGGSIGDMYIRMHKRDAHDVPSNKIYKWDESNGLEVFIEPSGYTGCKPLKIASGYH